LECEDNEYDREVGKRERGDEEEQAECFRSI